MEVRLFLILVTIFLVRGTLPAQNLVPNPSFECGNNQCDFTVMSSHVEFANIACYWSVPTKGTSDFFSTKLRNKHCWASMPPLGEYHDSANPHIGTQLPRTGDRFAGIFTLGTIYDYNFLADTAYREYLQVKLLETLVPGQYYCGEMYVSLAETPPNATNNLGMAFYNGKVEDYSYFHTIPHDPQVVEKNVILNSESWTRIYDYFMPDSSLEYLCIGNFFDDVETVYQDKLGNVTPLSDMAYYFIDDVSVTAVDLKPLISASFSVCRGSRALAIAKESLEDIVWTYEHDTSIVIGRGPYLNFKPDSTATYRVTAKSCKLSVSDTITIRVDPSPEVDLGPDMTICENDSAILDPGAGYLNYRWQDSSENQMLTVLQSGEYTVEVENEYRCKGHSEIKVSIKPTPRIDLGSDTLLCNNDYKPLAGGNGFDSWEWSTGSAEPVITPTAAGQYWLRVRDQCGEAVDTINIHTLDNLFIPNILTLNDDTVNRYLEVQGTGGGHYGRMSLFNRWGQEIYSDESYRNDWPEDPDDVPSGTYYYTYQYPGCPARKGWVKVMR